MSPMAPDARTILLPSRSLQHMLQKLLRETTLAIRNHLAAWKGYTLGLPQSQNL